MRLLDLFCGAGGAAMGYSQAGFDVIGVDNQPQPNYPFQFIQADWKNALNKISDVDAIHASPPCQAYSAMSNCRPGLASTYADLVAEVRSTLSCQSAPWIIENVPGSPLISPITLCGQMFKRDLYRHRLFESSVPLTQPYHPIHRKPASRAGHWKPGTVMSIAGHFSPVWKAREIMQISWMTRDEMRESIPPCYTRYIGSQLRAFIGGKLGQGANHQHP